MQKAECLTDCEKSKKDTNVRGIQVSASNSNEWVVPSVERGPSVQYHVAKLQDYHVCKCKLICPECHVCPHMFSCTCADYYTRTLPCKHIHAVQLTQCPTLCISENDSETDKFSCDVQGQGNETYTHSSNADYFRPFVCRNTDKNYSNVEQLKNHALQQVSNLLDVIQNCSSTDALKSIISHVASVSAIGKGLNEIKDSDQNSFKVQKNFRVNCHFKTQKRAAFFSTIGRPGRKKTNSS